MLENIRPVAELRTLARSKARAYWTKSVHHKLLSEETANGWELLKKRKTSVSLKKPKTHGVLLEDRVWTLLYRMQFAYLSGGGGGKLWLDPKQESGPKSQLDVVGIEDELALAVECKSQAPVQTEIFGLSKLIKNFFRLF